MEAEERVVLRGEKNLRIPVRRRVTISIPQDLWEDAVLWALGRGYGDLSTLVRVLLVREMGVKE